MRTWANSLYHFYTELNPPVPLPGNIQWLRPHDEPAVRKVVHAFLHKYFNDTNPRTLLLGINPGRYGAGVTGVNFTAPRQLRKICGIEHSFPDQSELSAEFIYDMIEAFGGPESFYSRFFIGSVCPLGFVKDGRNLNYYDDKALLEKVKPFIIDTIGQQVSFGVRRDTCLVIGGDKNLKQLLQWNERYKWFRKLEALPHPRFIMQYRRKQKDQFIAQYIQLLHAAQ